MKLLSRSIVLAPLFFLLAESPGTSAAPPPADIDRGIDQLGADWFSTREEASAFLWRVGTAVVPTLRAAALGRNLEVVARARAILRRLRLGIGPDAPAEIVDLVTRYRSGGDIAKYTILSDLFEKKAYLTLKILRTSERRNKDGLALRWAAKEWIATVPKLLAEGEVATAEGLLEIGPIAETPWVAQIYAAYLLLNGRLEDALRRHEARSREEGADRDRAVLLAYLHRASGDLSRARGAAERSGDRDLLDGILFEQNDWIALSRRWQEIDPKAKFESLAFAAAYHRSAGNTAAFEKAIAAIRDDPDGPKLLDHEEAFVLNDRPEECLALMVAEGRYDRGFELLCGQLRYREAFALVDRVEAGAIGDLRPEESGSRRSLAVAKARLLHRLGERERARQVLLKLVDEIPTTSEPWLVYPGAVVAERDFGLKDLAFEHMARLLERTHALHKDDEHGVTWALSALFPALNGTQSVDIFWRALRRRYPDDSPSSLLKRLRDLLDGPGRDGAASLARDSVAVLAMIPDADKRERELSNLARGCEALGLDELAASSLERATEVARSASAWERMGCFLARKARWHQADDSFRRACELDDKQPVYLARRGCMLVRIGRDGEGRALIDQARRLALGDDTAHQSLAQAFREHGLADEARREVTLLLRIGELNSWPVSDACQQLFTEAMDRKDYARASLLWERSSLHVLRVNSVLLDDGIPALGLASLSHELRAYARLAEGQVELAIREARLALALIPGDVALLETLVPRLRALGRDAEADQLATPALRLLEGICADYPRAAKHHNGLAWLDARCRVDLDRGLEHARKAVAIDPSNVSYLDTLAEVQFLRGERGEAIAIMKRCIALRPQDRRLCEKLDRFEAGEPDGRGVKK